VPESDQDQGQEACWIGSIRFSLHRENGKAPSQPDSVGIVYWCLWTCWHLLPSTKRDNEWRTLPKSARGQSPSLHGHLPEHTLLQDGAPFHASKRIKDFLKDKPLEVIDWPGNSPDVNPVENAWNFMKNMLSTQDISSLPKLKEAILKMRTRDISTEYLSSLSNSIPKRIEAVIKNHSDMMKY
jgi:transposase